MNDKQHLAELRELLTFEAAAKLTWNKHRSKWTQPDWDHLPIASRLAMIAMAKTFAGAIGATTKDVP